MTAPHEDAFLRLAQFHRSRNSLVGVYTVNDMLYTQSIYFTDVDLLNLEQRYGKDAVERIYAHIFAVYAIAFFIFFPKKISLGPLARYVTEGLETFVRHIFLNAKSEWIYVNQAAGYSGPVWIDQSTDCHDPIELPLGNVSDLFFNGGGKDSLVSMKLLDQSQIPFSVLSVSDDLYGRSHQQHERNKDVVKNTSSVDYHQVYTTGTWVNSPLVETTGRQNVKTFIQVEYEVYFFFGLILCLDKGYRNMAVGFERSAAEGNLIPGYEDVNHQWDKTETFVDEVRHYAQRELVRNVDVYSVLGNLYDPAIFLLCRAYVDQISSTHSCNVMKPWCLDCVKCAYTLFSLAAYLDESLDDLFGIDALNLPGLLPFISDLIGQGEQKPFECIGSPRESALIFEILLRKGASGKAVERYKNMGRHIDFSALIDRYTRVYADSFIPEIHREKLMGVIESTVEKQKDLLLNPLQRSS